MTILEGNAELLQANPELRMAVAMRSGAEPSKVKAQLERLGVDPSRVEFRERFIEAMGKVDDFEYEEAAEVSVESEE